MVAVDGEYELGCISRPAPIPSSIARSSARAAGCAGLTCASWRSSRTCSAAVSSRLDGSCSLSAGAAIADGLRVAQVPLHRPSPAAGQRT